MNKIFKVVWSKVKHCYVVVSEIAKNTTSGGARRCRMGKVSLAAAMAAAVLTGSFAMPNSALAADGEAPANSYGEAPADSYVAIHERGYNYISESEQKNYEQVKVGDTYFYVRKGFHVTGFEIKNNQVIITEVSADPSALNTDALQSTKTSVDNIFISDNVVATTRRGYYLKTTDTQTYAAVTNGGGTTAFVQKQENKVDSASNLYGYNIVVNNTKITDKFNEWNNTNGKVEKAEYRDGRYYYDGKEVNVKSIYYLTSTHFTTETNHTWSGSTDPYVFLYNSGTAWEVYDGVVYGNNGEVLSTGVDAEGNIYTYWAAESNDLYTPVTKMTVSELNTRIEEHAKNMAELAKADFNSISLTPASDKSQNNVIDFKDFAGDTIDSINVSVTGGTSDSTGNRKVLFSNGKGSFELETGSIVSALVDEPTSSTEIKGISINGVEYKIASNTATDTMSSWKAIINGVTTVKEIKPGDDTLNFVAKDNGNVILEANNGDIVISAVDTKLEVPTDGKYDGTPVLDVGNNGTLTLTVKDTAGNVVVGSGSIADYVSNNTEWTAKVGDDEATVGNGKNLEFKGAGAAEVSLNGNTNTITISATDTYATDVSVSAADAGATVSIVQNNDKGNKGFNIVGEGSVTVAAVDGQVKISGIDTKYKVDKGEVTADSNQVYKWIIKEEGENGKLVGEIVDTDTKILSGKVGFDEKGKYSIQLQTNEPNGNGDNGNKTIEIKDLHDYYTTGATYDKDAKIATFTRLDGETYTLNLADITSGLGTMSSWKAQVVGENDPITIEDDDTLFYEAGNNIVLASDVKKITVATADEVTFDKVTVGNDVIVDNSGIVITNDNNSLSFTKNNVSVGGNKITNVANGSVAQHSTEAVNGDQLWTAMQEDIASIQISSSVQSNEKDTVSLIRNNGDPVVGALKFTSGGGNPNEGDTYVNISNGTGIGITLSTGSVVRANPDKVDSYTQGEALEVLTVNGRSYSVATADFVEAAKTEVIAGSEGINNANSTNDNLTNVVVRPVQDSDDTNNIYEISVADMRVKSGKAKYEDNGTGSIALTNGDGTTATISDLHDYYATGLDVVSDSNNGKNLQLTLNNGDTVVMSLSKITAGLGTMSGWKAQVKNGNVTGSEITIANNETLTYEAGSNIVLGSDGKKITVATADKVTFDEVTVGNDVIVDNSGIVITNDNNSLSFTKNNVSVGGNKITNVADGDVSVDSKDAINGSQLNAVKTELDNLADNVGNINDIQNNDLTTNNVVNHINNLYAKVENAATEANKKTTVTGSSNITVESTTDDSGNTYYEVDLNNDITLTTKDAIDNVTGQVEIKSSDSTVTVGTVDAKKVSIDGANGSVVVGKINITGNDTDGNATITGLTNTYWDGENIVSGRAATEDQLKQAISNVTTTLTQSDKYVDYNKTYGVNVENEIVLDVVNSDKDVIIENVAKHSDLGNVGDFNSDLKNSDNSHTSVVQAVNRLDDKVNKGWTAKINGKDVQNIQMGSSQNFVDGQNIELTASGDDIVVSTAKDVTFEKVTVGDVVVDSVGIHAGDKKITNVANGELSEKSTDAVNGSQLHATNQVVINNYENIQNLSAQNQQLDSRINQLGSKVNKVGAGAAALAALHPMDFDPDDKLSFSAGVGNYAGQTATALGAFYRPNEKVMMSIGGTYGNNENMVNMGVSFALDRTNNVSNSRTAMAREIVDLREQVATQGQQIAQLVALVNQLASVKEPVTPTVQPFPDVPANHWAYEYLNNLVAMGVIEGYPDGTFGGDRTMTRYEFATMLFKAMQNGAVLSEQIRQEFNAELGRIRVDRIKGADDDANKIERVRVNNYEDRDDYGSKIVMVSAGK